MTEAKLTVALTWFPSSPQRAWPFLLGYCPNSTYQAPAQHVRAYMGLHSDNDSPSSGMQRIILSGALMDCLRSSPTCIWVSQCFSLAIEAGPACQGQCHSCNILRSMMQACIYRVDWLHRSDITIILHGKEFTLELQQRGAAPWQCPVGLLKARQCKQQSH